MNTSKFTALSIRQDLDGFFKALQNGKVTISHRFYGEFDVVASPKKQPHAGQSFAEKIHKLNKQNKITRAPKELTYKSNREMYDTLSKY